MINIRERARQLRKNPTDAEKLLWQKLRYWQLGGLKFRRQLPIGPYIVDFACLEKRLIVEVDGGQHAEQSAYDNDRDAWLRNQNFVVLRFWNTEVMQNIDGVMQVIIEKLRSSPFLRPSPQGGRKRNRRRDTQSSRSDTAKQ